MTANDVDKPAAARPPVLAISSQVASGSVGLRAAAFALERRGHEVVTVPTVVLPWHPGRGRGTAVRPGEDAFAALLRDLAGSDLVPGLGGVLTGYFASAAQVAAAAALVEAVRARNPGAVVLVDPVCGDARGPYVPEAVVAALRNQLLPLADAATPNRFELAILAGMPTDDEAAAIAAARALGPGTVAVTSAPVQPDAAGRPRTGALLVSPGRVALASHAAVALAPHGTGDLFSALFLSERLAGADDAAALARAGAACLAAIRAAADAGAEELPLARCQDALAAPPLEAVALSPAGKTAAGPLAATPSATVAGVDGCTAGWIAVLVAADGPLRPEIVHARTFAELMERAPAVVAVDMPIGLPERIEGPGRAAEQAVRPLLGERQSSVFSIPARAAVMARDYAEACRLALATSDPPRKVSRQGFMLFAKIREIDAFLAERPDAPVHEVHPEVSFWRLNGERPMALPKKVKGRADRPGLDERIALLCRHGFEPGFFEARRPSGCGLDDLVDAAVNALVARRIAAGLARPFPDPPARDARGLPIAIWA